MTKPALPSYEPPQEGTMYSESEVEHIVARRVMSHRLDDFERGLMSLSNQVKESNAKIEASLNSLDANIDRHYTHVSECRDDMRLEIERDFVTKVEFVQGIADVKSTVDHRLDQTERTMAKWAGIIVGALAVLGLLTKFGLL